MTKRLKRTDPQEDRKAAFLEAYSQVGTVLHACRAAGISRTQVYKWRTDDDDFAAAWDAAGEENTERLEASAYQRAMGGDATLTIFLLKGRRPDKYRENYSFQGSLEVTGGLTLSATIDEEIAAKAAELEGVKARLEAERLTLPEGSGDITGEPI